MSNVPRRGVGNEYDASMKINSNLATSTSQFKAVVMDPTDGADVTVKLIDTSATALGAYHAVGIIQSVQSAGSTDATVRFYGISKAIAGAAFTSGANVQCVEATAGANTGGNVIVYAMADTSAGSALVTRRVLGIALQNATATGQAVEVLIQPTLINH